jgi:hypothetical protein
VPSVVTVTANGQLKLGLNLKVLLALCGFWCLWSL